MNVTFTLWEDQDWQLSFISNMVFQPAETAKLRFYVLSEDVTLHKTDQHTLCHLLATAWRSFISDLSNHTWGQDRTIDLWMTPMRPP